MLGSSPYKTGRGRCGEERSQSHSSRLSSVAADLTTHTRRLPPGVEPRCATHRMTDEAVLHRLVRIRVSVVIFLDMGLERASEDPGVSSVSTEVMMVGGGHLRDAVFY